MAQPEPSAASQHIPQTTQPTRFFNLAALKNSLKKYGRTGVAVYLGISCTVTAGFYIAIEQHFDVKKFLNIEDTPEGREPTWVERAATGKGSTLALAILCSKALVPIKLPVALAITPYVHRTVQSMFRTAAAKGS